MRKRSGSEQLDNLAASAGRFQLISTDVFDTLLLRNRRSERSRIGHAETLFSHALAKKGFAIQPHLLIDLRLQAQRLAFRALGLRAKDGDVKLSDLIGRQLRVLGLPQSLRDDRERIEIDVEKQSLTANHALAQVLRAHRAAGAKIVATSDSTLSTEAIAELIRDFHGDLVDHVYSSADMGLTKRNGDLFEAVATKENIALITMAHVGDDPHADRDIPQAKGISVFPVPRPDHHRYARGVDRTLTALRGFADKQCRVGGARRPAPADTHSFGRDVFGPIVAQLSIQTWLYVAEAESEGETVVLFCARGGIGMREAFERMAEKVGLSLRSRRENIMISRLVAARAAILVQSDAAAQELDREFRGSTYAEVAASLGGGSYALPDAWQQAFNGRAFLGLLFGSSGAEVLSDIRQQNELFTRHFTEVVGSANRIVLCDTGLYGSTQRLLAQGFPGLRIETIQFARSNYKGHSEEHFPKVAGLLVQQSHYSPLNPSSSVLRYWHLIESLFEPSIPSVKSFALAANGRVVGNCGPIEFGAIDPAAGNPLLAGALSYIDGLPHLDGGRVALSDTEAAWHRLKRAVTRPTPADLRCLAVEARSVDFGRARMVPIFTEQQNSPLTRMRSLKTQLWREGAIAREFPILSIVLLPLLGSVHSLRGLIARGR